MSEPSVIDPLPRRLTDYLKGVAVVAVIVNHYAILYFFAPQTWANSLMTFFFLLSGAGIYLSLDRDAAADATSKRVLVRYAFRRASRIYPLYWLAYALFIAELYWVHGYTASFEPLNLLAAAAGFPVDPRGIYWFVTAILQCYIFAPLLYGAVKRWRPAEALGSALIFAGVALLASLFVLERIGNETLRDMLEYKQLFLGNVILFYLGMLIPGMVSRHRGAAGRVPARLAGIAAFVLLVYATDAPDRLFTGSKLYLAPLLFAAAAAVCVTLSSAAPWLPAGGLLRLAGRYSYPLYLLHLPFFILLVQAGLIEPESYARIAWTALLFPLFFLLCIGLQKVTTRSFSVKLSA